jgi:predicted DNA binding protein
MSVIAEFTLPVDAFPLGVALRTAEDMRLELERVVPLSDAHIPYVWVEGEGFDEFERQVRADPYIDGITRLDRVDGRALYRLEWAETESGLINGIRAAKAAIMEANGRETWQFRLHFPDHDRLADFYNYCTAHEIPIHLDRVYTLAEASREGRAFDLTPEQREALVLALRRGYFDTPRLVDLETLADELDISKQALSQRIRKATERVLHDAMLSASAFD